MRIIKFRAWDGWSMIMNIAIGRHFGDIKNACNTVIQIDDGDTWVLEEQQSLVPMQYTGLKDKNDVEIYEGDICDFEFVTGNCNCEIIFANGAFGINRNFGSFGPLSSFLLNCVSVVGNIYENPELLN